MQIKVSNENLREEGESNKPKHAYMDCKFLKSPMAGDISPPRFKLDRFLQNHDKSLNF